MLVLQKQVREIPDVFRVERTPVLVDILSQELGDLLSEFETSVRLVAKRNSIK